MQTACGLKRLAKIAGYGSGPLYPQELHVTVLSQVTQSQAWMQVLEDFFFSSGFLDSAPSTGLENNWSQNEQRITVVLPAVYRTGP